MGQKYVGTIDQGTTSSRFILFNKRGKIVSQAQMEHAQIYPKPGWVEHNPIEILKNCKKVIKKAVELAEIDPQDICSVGITNQRETIVAWNKITGEPYYNAIVWQDMRGKEILDQLLSLGLEKNIHKKTGLIPAPYFSASKIKWLLDNVTQFNIDAKKGEALVGTIDSWILWNLSDANKEAPHLTDVTNASRYMLMDIQTLSWDEELLKLFSIPISILPTIVASIPKKPYGVGTLKDKGKKIPLIFSGILGDQQAALFGQTCFYKGQSKCTYGTGGFLLMNIGEKLAYSHNGLLTTVAYQIEGEAAVYALEGSIAVAGSLVQWVRDNLGMISSAPEIDKLAASVSDSGDVYFVPAFAGLFAPHWKPNARGVICGLTGYATKAHICRAVLESTAFQVLELFQAIADDSGIDLPVLKVDGGMSVSEPLMQIQADFLSATVVRPAVIETTALGAAYCAGLSAQLWHNLEELLVHQKEGKRYTPKMDSALRLEKIMGWHKAIERSLGWV